MGRQPRNLRFDVRVAAVETSLRSSSCARDWNVGWFKLILGALMVGPYMYYRIYLTDLGEDMLVVFDEER